MIEQKRVAFVAEFKDMGENNGVGRFSGYGSVFGNTDSYNDVCDKGCFTRSLNDNGLPAMLYQHDARDVIGVWTVAKEDKNGLLLEGEINLEVQKGKEAYALLKQGAIKGLSIGFRTKTAAFDKDGKRHLKDVDLMEVSLVTFPANQEAQVISVKSELPETEREFEATLIGLGYSQKQAKTIVSKGFKGLFADQRDVESVTANAENAARDVEALKAAIENLKHSLKL